MSEIGQGLIRMTRVGQGLIWVTEIKEVTTIYAIVVSVFWVLGLILDKNSNHTDVDIYKF